MTVRDRPGPMLRGLARELARTRGWRAVNGVVRPDPTARERRFLNRVRKFDSCRGIVG